MVNVLIPKHSERIQTLIAIPKKEYEENLMYQRNRSKLSAQRLGQVDPETAEVLALVKRAQRDYEKGATRTISSPKELDIA